MREEKIPTSGIIELPSRLVESLIALSIVYVAVENLLGKGFGRRWLVAGGLGLVHGPVSTYWTAGA